MTNLSDIEKRCEADINDTHVRVCDGMTNPGFITTTRSTAKFLRDNYTALSPQEAEVIAERLEVCAGVVQDLQRQVAELEGALKLVVQSYADDVGEDPATCEWETFKIARAALNTETTG